MQKLRSRLPFVILLLAISLSSILINSSFSAAESNHALGHAVTGTESVRSPTLTAYSPASPNQTLSLSMVENAGLPGYGSSSPLTVEINVPSGPLANTYRNMFGASNATVNSVVPMPQVSPSGMTAASYYQTFAQQQQVSLGIVANITSSSMVPLTSLGAFNATLGGSALFNATIGHGSSSDTWRVFLGSNGPNGTSQLFQNIFSYMISARWLLNATSMRAYQSRWDVFFQLPTNGTLANGASLSGMNWTIAFGGGSYVAAGLSLADQSSVDLTEVTMVTSQNITMTPSSIQSALTGFENFEIDYSTPPSSTAPGGVLSISPFPDFSIDWSVGINPSFTIPTLDFGDQVCNAQNNCVSEEIRTTAQATLGASLGIHLDWNPGSSFDTYFQVDLSTNLKFDTQFTTAASHQFTLARSPRIHITTFWFFIAFLVPAWADLNVVLEADLSVGLQGTIDFSSQASLSDTFKAGLQWTNSNGWGPIISNSFSESLSAPQVGAQIAGDFQLSFPIQVQLLLYSVAGPAVNFTPYADVTLTLASTGTPPPGTWKLDLGFRIEATVAFEQHLKDLLGLGDNTLTLYNVILKTFTGNFTGTPQFTTSVSTTTSSVQSGASVPVTGKAITSSGSPIANATVSIGVFGSSGGAISTASAKTNNTGIFTATITAPTTAGSYSVRATVTVGSFSATGSFILTVLKDTVPPVVTPTVNPSPNGAGWNNGNVTIAWTTYDPDGGISSTSGCQFQTLTKETAGTTITCTATDGGGLSTSASVTVKIDLTPPNSTISIGSPKFVSGSTYVSVNTPFSLSATDNLSGVDHTSYGIDNSTTPNVYSSPFTISKPGIHTIYFRSTDVAGDVEPVKSITVIVGATKVMYNGNVQGQYSDYGNLTATLIEMATQQPIPGKTITFTLVSQSASGVTNSTGTASARLQLNQASGTYTLTSSFAGDITFLASSTTSSMTIVKEDASISYTGDMVVGTTATGINLRATFIEDPDNHLGDLTKANVTFRIYATDASSTLLQTVGPVRVSATGTPGVGVALISIPNMSENTYIIIVSLDPTANSYYTAPNGFPVALVVFQPNGSFVTGGGFINDTGSNANFGFIVRYTSSGQVQGHFVYIYRIAGQTYILKSTSWIGLAIINNHATFQGKATLTIVPAGLNLATATSLTSTTIGNYQFKDDAYDNTGTTTNGGIDQFFLTIWDKNGVVFHTAGGNLLGGDIQVHK